MDWRSQESFSHWCLLMSSLSFELYIFFIFFFIYRYSLFIHIFYIFWAFGKILLLYPILEENNYFLRCDRTFQSKSVLLLNLLLSLY